MIGTILQGVIIGIANIIPGVSGGTMAVVLGIYDRLINCLCNFNIASLNRLKNIITTSENRSEDFKKFIKDLDIYFLSCLGIGMVITVIALSKVIIYFLEDQHDPTYGFFFGLIIVSIWVPYKMMDRFSFKEFITLILGILFALALTFSLSSEDKIKAAQNKAEYKAAKAERKAAIKAGNILPANEINDSEEKSAHSINNLGYYFFCGMIAISAMILPGVSGSFLLITLGVYFEILNALARMDLTIIAVFSVGCGIGILAFVRLLNYIIKYYRNQTMGFLAGLMVGSLWNIWPFKATIEIYEKTIYLNNKLPMAIDSNVIITLMSCIVAGFIVFGFIHFEKK